MQNHVLVRANWLLYAVCCRGDAREERQSPMGSRLTSGNVPFEKTLFATLISACYVQRRCKCDKARGRTHISKQVFPQAPSPTMTSLRRSSAILGPCECENAQRLKRIVSG
jgi:hypothetical protein